MYSKHFHLFHISFVKGQLVPLIEIKGLKTYFYTEGGVVRAVVPIEGVVPDLLDAPRGCGFDPCCPKTDPVCDREIPVLQEIEPGHRVACWQINKKDEAAIVNELPLRVPLHWILSWWWQTNRSQL